MSDVELDLEYSEEIEEDEDWIYENAMTPGNFLYLDMVNVLEREMWFDDPMVTDLEIYYRRDFIETLGWLFDGILEGDEKRLNIMEQVNMDLNKHKSVRTVH